MNEDIRWVQRFSNYQKAVSQLTEFIEKGELNKFEIQGLIQCFEYTFELAWKTLKDYLENEGFEVKSPRSSLQTAFQIELLDDGHVWLDALSKRNLMAHTYNEAFVKEAQQLIVQSYYPQLKKLEQSLEVKKCALD